METPRSHEGRRPLDEVFGNADETMLAAADAALKHGEELPNGRYVIHEVSPSARGTGRAVDQEGIPQFNGDNSRSRAF